MFHNSKSKSIANITIFREEITSALAGFQEDPLSWSNWNLEMLVFAEGGEPEKTGEKPSEQGENQQQAQPTYGTGPSHIGGRRALSPLRHACSPSSKTTLLGQS